MVGNRRGEYWEVKNGYANSTQYKLQQLCEVMRHLDDSARDTWRDSIQIGLHTDVQVAFTSRGVLHPTVYDAGYVDREAEPQLVTQAFCSALGVSYSGLPAVLWEPLGRLILQATYEATMWAALRNGVRAGTGVSRPTVVLTFLGGGAFGNPMEWIVDAIGRALAIMVIEEAEIEVQIMHFRSVNTLVERQIQHSMEQWVKLLRARGRISSSKQVGRRAGASKEGQCGRILERLFEKHDKSKLPNINKLLETYKGRENQLIAAVRGNYEGKHDIKKGYLKKKVPGVLFGSSFTTHYFVLKTHYLHCYEVSQPCTLCCAAHSCSFSPTERRMPIWTSGMGPCVL
jgi:hypothetical protein